MALSAASEGAKFDGSDEHSLLQLAIPHILRAQRLLTFLINLILAAKRIILSLFFAGDTHNKIRILQCYVSFFFDFLTFI